MLIRSKFEGYKAGIRLYNGKGGDAPPPPDYEKAARETAKANLEMAKYTTQTNRVNQVNPYGSINYTRPTQKFDEAGYNAALEKYNAPANRAPIQYDGELGDWVNQTPTQKGTAPRREDFMTDDGQWTQTMSLDPRNQALLDKQYAMSNQYADLAQQAMGGIGQIGNNQSNQSQLLANRLASGGGGGAIGVNMPTARDVNMDLSGLRNVNDLTLDGLPQAPINAGQTAEQAIFSRLNPTLARDEEAMRTRLANQGIALGSTAYNREMDLQGQRANDLRLQAAAQGISLDQAARQQALGEQQAVFNSQMSQRQQGLTEQQALANVGLTQRGQDVSSATALGTAGIGANASLEAARMNSSIAAQNAANQYDIQNRNMLMQERLAPIQYVNALRAGSQVMSPTFQGVSQQANVAGPDLLGATNQLYSQQMAGYNAGQAANASMMGGLFGLGGAALMAPTGTFAGLAALSDIRAKENIKQVGQLDNGLNVYEYTYKPEFDIPGIHVGVMAQEVVKVKPEAIVMRDDGYMAVNYAMI